MTSKLVQRKETAFFGYLRAADELAWSCYKPVLRLRCPDPVSPCRREPPLVFLNGGLSPFALSRDRAFQAEEVVGELLPEDRKLQRALKQLPISVIGVPWYQAGHLPDALVIAHETGHTVESDFGLKGEAGAGMLGAVSEAHRPAWSAWEAEAFADLYGCLTAGPAYVSSLMDFLAVDPEIVRSEMQAAPAWKAYPSTELRLGLCRAALELMGFGPESEKLGEKWRATYSTNHLMSGFDRDLKEVAKAVLQTGYGALKGTALLDVPSLAFSRAEWDEAQTATDFLKDGSEPVEAQSPRALFAAARIQYDRAPSNSGETGRLVLSRFESIIKPGTRALDEDEMDEERRGKVTCLAQQRGQSAFESFAEVFGES